MRHAKGNLHDVVLQAMEYCSAAGSKFFGRQHMSGEVCRRLQDTNIVPVPSRALTVLPPSHTQVRPIELP